MNKSMHSRDDIVETRHLQANHGCRSRAGFTHVRQAQVGIELDTNLGHCRRGGAVDTSA